MLDLNEICGFLMEKKKKTKKDTCVIVDGNF